MFEQRNYNHQGTILKKKKSKGIVHVLVLSITDKAAYFASTSNTCDLHIYRVHTVYII